MDPLSEKLTYLRTRTTSQFLEDEIKSLRALRDVVLGGERAGNVSIIEKNIEHLHRALEAVKSLENITGEVL